MIGAGLAVVVAGALLFRPVAKVTIQSAAEVKLTGDQLCSRDLKQFVQFKDPDSVRINSVKPNEQRPGRYWMSVSAKNSYGGYGDPTTCSCGTDASAGRVTDLYCDGAGNL
jgi:hypothetical protein